METRGQAIVAGVMRSRRAAPICALVLAAIAASPAQAAEQRVLLVNEARGFVHESIPAATAFFRGLGERSTGYDVIPLSGGAAQLTARRLRRADAVVFANTSGELPLPDRPALRAFVRRGGAFIGTHSASDTLHSWPAFEGLLGGEFARHGAVQEGRLIVARRPHPITRGLPPSFTLTDEFYEFAAPVPSDARILVRLDPESVPDEAGQDVPLVWARRYGQGRVFYDALGHPPATWEHRLHRRMLARGVAWALRR
jgi:type 1 glutamine amidotransferase